MLANVNTVATIIASLIGLVLTAVGIYFANNQRQQLDIHVADQLVKAYADLWALMKVAAPMRTPEGGSLSSDERHKLFDHLTDWYYADGNGMLLEMLTRELYLAQEAWHTSRYPRRTSGPPTGLGLKALAAWTRGHYAPEERYHTSEAGQSMDGRRDDRRLEALVVVRRAVTACMAWLPWPAQPTNSKDSVGGTCRSSSMGNLISKPRKPASDDLAECRRDTNTAAELLQ